MRLIRHFAAARRLLLVSGVVLAPALGLATGCSSVRKAIDNANGTSYVTPAKITDPSTDPDIATESFSFNDPPAISAINIASNLQRGKPWRRTE